MASKTKVKIKAKYLYRYLVPLLLIPLGFEIEEYFTEERAVEQLNEIGVYFSVIVQLIVLWGSIEENKKTKKFYVCKSGMVAYIVLSNVIVLTMFSLNLNLIVISPFIAGLMTAVWMRFFE